MPYVQNSNVKFGLALLLLLGMFVTSALAQDESAGSDTVSYSQFRGLLDAGDIESATIWDEGWWITGKLKDGSSYSVRINPTVSLADQMATAGVATKFAREPEYEEEELPLLLSLFLNILPLLIFFVFVFYLFRSINKGPNSVIQQSIEINEEARQINHEFLERLDDVLTRHRNG